MRAFKLTHLSDAALVRRLSELVVRDRVVTAALLAHIAEVDARRLYVPAGYPSMHAYCVDALHLSEGAAYKRIWAARTAREFPALLPALAEGRLHLAAICLLAPHLTPQDADELIAAAEHRRKSEIERFLADRFPLAGGAKTMRSQDAVTPLPRTQQSPGTVDTLLQELGAELSPGTVESAQPGAEAPPTPARKFALYLTIDERTHDKLRRAQALLSHAVPSGDLAQVVDRALDVLIERLEKRKFAATARPRRGANAKTPHARNVPAQVRRAVWERDACRCTFIGDRGQRCPARKLLEFDHIDPVARGGRASVDRMRLRCRAHNQFEAERAFGVEFMRGKREAARARAAAREQAREQAKAQSRDVVTALRALGLRAEEARRAAELSLSGPNATLEDRVRAALQSYRPRRAFAGAERRASEFATSDRGYGAASVHSP